MGHSTVMIKVLADFTGGDTLFRLIVVMGFHQLV